MRFILLFASTVLIASQPLTADAGLVTVQHFDFSSATWSGIGTSTATTSFTALDNMGMSQTINITAVASVTGGPPASSPTVTLIGHGLGVTTGTGDGGPQEVGVGSNGSIESLTLTFDSNIVIQDVNTFWIQSVAAVDFITPDSTINIATGQGSDIDQTWSFPGQQTFPNGLTGIHVIAGQGLVMRGVTANGGTFKGATFGWSSAPEPSSLILLVMAGVGSVFRRRRDRKAVTVCV